MQMKGKGG